MPSCLAIEASPCSITTESTPPDRAAQIDLFRAEALSSDADKARWMRSTTAEPCARVACAAAGLLRMGLLRAGFLELAIAHEALEAFFHEQGGLFRLELLERLGQRLAQRLPHGFGVSVRAAKRLVDDLVHQAERLQPAGSDAERLRGLRR